MKTREYSAVDRIKNPWDAVDRLVVVKGQTVGWEAVPIEAQQGQDLVMVEVKTVQEVIPAGSAGYNPGLLVHKRHLDAFPEREYYFYLEGKIISEENPYQNGQPVRFCVIPDSCLYVICEGN
ncbi:MAG: hypothetical protein WCG84_00380 [Candidatus Moraniibacteriota bacterium]